jgi:ketosteroid isomerase-like protein
MPMSGEKIDIIRSGYAAFSKGDVDALKPTVAENVDWGTSGAFPGLEPVYRGPDALERWMDAVLSAWEWFDVTIDAVLSDQDDFLVIRERLRGRGRESGAEVDMHLVSVYWFEGGRLAKRRVFDSEREALAAVGLA